MFRALETWLKNVVAVHPADGKEPETMSERVTCVTLGHLWESYAHINDPRLLQELHRLAQKGERRYQDAFWYAATLGHMELAVTLLEYDVTVNTETFGRTVLNGYIEAGIDIKDKDITSLLDRPLKQVHPDVIGLLRKAGCQEKNQDKS